MCAAIVTMPSVKQAAIHYNSFQPCIHFHDFIFTIPILRIIHVHQFTPVCIVCSAGCHGRGRLDRGSPDYTFDGTLALTTVPHSQFDEGISRMEALQKAKVLYILISF